MIKAKLTEKELALADVLEDPIFCAEFMRSTRDGSPNKESWPKKPFQYRWYQRDILTDISPRVILRGGRAIGKCQPESTRVLTKDGYKSIRELRRQPYFVAYALNDKGEFVQSRAIIQKDSQTQTYKVTLANGLSTISTINHPYLTPKGYVSLELLDVGDDIAVPTHIPYENGNKAVRWHELRLLGYIMLNPTWALEMPMIPKTRRIRAELYAIAKHFDMAVFENNDTLLITRKRTGLKNPITQFFTDLGKRNFHKQVNERDREGGPGVLRRVPDVIMTECNENTKVFLEAVLGQGAKISRKMVSAECYSKRFAKDLQELFLRFGVVSKTDGSMFIIDNPTALYRLFTEFDIPGVSVENIEAPPHEFQPATNYTFVPIVSIEPYYELHETFSIFVYDHMNYIADGMIVHNSLVLEDKIVYGVLNQHTIFPETKEQLLATANQSQIEPILGRLIQRFTTSHLLKEFLQNRVNRTLGVLEFRFNDIPFLLRARIAGSDGQSNMVGLHVPQINIDEAQLFTINAWTQLAPALNDWEQMTQVFITGVPNGLRNSLLYYAEKKLSQYKVYSVPAHNNPYYTKENNLENVKRYGGIDTDEYQQLVLGEHGKAAFSVLTRDQIKQQPYDMHKYTFTNEHITQGKHYSSVLDLLDFNKYSTLCAGIDTGYVDPTVITVMGLNDKGLWVVLVRYVLKRIDFPTQEKIIHYLHKHYKFDKIGLDIGAGGGGTQILHSFLYREDYKSVNYAETIVPVQFNERIAVGYDTEGKELTVSTKTLGAELLVQQLQQGSIILSQMDFELVSELERITKQRSMNGDDRYFILSDKGNGASTEDHNFASMICFCIATRDLSFQKKRRKRLGRTGGGY